MKRAVFAIFSSLILLAALFSYQTGVISEKRMHIVFCDVGQGDAIYIRTPGGADILVDGGPNDSVSNCLSNHMPFWDRTIELVFATHPDADHITGLVSVMESYSVKSFNTVSAGKDTKIFETLKKTISDQKIPYQEISAGSKFRLSDGVAIETKWPQEEFSSEDSNEHSLVQVLKYGEFDLLLTGDITFEILNSLDFGSDSIEVLKLPHHGSKTGVNSSTFQKINALLAVISAGRNNSYHHPHPSVLSLLKKYNVPSKRTDLEGEIRIVTDGKTTKTLN